MTKKKKALEFKAWQKRLWLNNIKHGGTAFINMSIDEISKARLHAYTNGTIDIADCSRIISLEFYVDSNEKFYTENAIRKLDLIISSLSLFKEKLNVAIAAAQKSNADAKKIETERKVKKAAEKAKENK